MSYENVIVFGPVGSGKTTILNLLTGQNYQTASSGYSCTRVVQKAVCEYHPFRVLDFPGTDATKDIVRHVNAQADALKGNHFRVICIVHKMTSRLDDVSQRLSKVYRLFRHHRGNIVVILTHCDNFSLKERAEVAYVFENKFKLPYVFEKEMKTTGAKLADWIYSFIAPNEKQIAAGIQPFTRVDAGEGHFETDGFAKLVSDTEVDSAVIDSRIALEKRFREIYAQHVAEFRRSEEPELKRALYFSLKNYMDSISEEHAAFVAPLFSDVWAFNAELIVFQNSLMAIYKPFKTMVVHEIKVETVVYNNETSSYRQCPHCGLIWLRIYGCDTITCGKRSLSRDTSNRTFYNYTIKFIGSGLNIIRAAGSIVGAFQENGEVTGLTTTEVQENVHRLSRDVAQIKPQGCGAALKWSTMLDKTKEVEDILREFEFSHHSETENIVKRHEGEVSQLPQAASSGSPTPSDKGKEKEGQNASAAADWSVEEVSAWLDSIAMSSAKARFEEEGINGSALLGLDKADLREMGIVKLGDVKNLLHAITQIP